jgi:hypothetical protein
MTRQAASSSSDRRMGTSTPSANRAAITSSAFITSINLRRVPRMQRLLKRFVHAGFHFVAADRQQVVAPTLIACSEAREPVAPSHDESGAADATFRQPRDQVLRTARPSEMAG